MTKVPNIIEELERERKNIKTDQYSMSIGELINLYKDGDILLNPAFQRLFRWTEEQKSKFIESILVGIPIPEIFVAQSGDGKWTIVDGVQRISTILQLVGILPNKQPLKMSAEKYLPSLEGLTWEDLPEDIHRILKRSKFSINIILTENSIFGQFELFQRLNTGGLHLEPQEIRNCLIIMLDQEFYDKINDLKDYEPFKNTLQLKEKKYEEEYHMELILRYFIAVHGKTDYEEYSLYNLHLSDFLDKETVRLIEDSDFNINEEINKFKEVFSYISTNIGSNAFRKYDHDSGEYSGSFTNYGYEAIATGIGYNFEKVKNLSPESVQEKCKDIFRDSTFLENTRHGVKAPVRFKNLTNFSKSYFSNE